MKRYHDIVGDGGSRILEQVAEQRARISDGLAGVRHLVAVGSGKGGVGKSTLTLHLAGALRARGLRIAILDADFNGPSQARMAGVQGGLFVPGSHKVALPRTTNGIAVFSMGSLIPESEPLEFESAAHGESQTWRATKEFSLLGEILGSSEWGALDLLMFDLPPGAERTVQYADFLGPRTSFLLVTIPSEVARGVVARSVAALSKGPNRVLGYVENMSGYYCRDCNAIKPLFVSGRGASPRRTPLRAHSRGPHDPRFRLRESYGGRAEAPAARRRAVRAGRALGAPEPFDLGIPCLGTVPFDPELALHCDRGIPLAELPETPVGRALEHVAQQLLNSLEPASAPASRELRPGKEPHR
jgi:ATP-binding protein involved in chromosome partitioning